MRIRDSVPAMVVVVALPVLAGAQEAPTQTQQPPAATGEEGTALVPGGSAILIAAR
jgi:hypothetical protein